MSKWAGKLAVVTGASVGIGADVVRKLVKHGVDVACFARRIENLEALSKEMKNCKGKVYPLKVDVTKDDEVEQAFKWIDDNLKKPVRILVNNAGVALKNNISECNSEDWKVMFNTNVIAVGICISHYVKSMKRYNAIGGHIVTINSTLGHNIVDLEGFYVYSATKHALKVICEGFRRDLLKNNPHKISVSNVSPGQVSTELLSKYSNTDVGKALKQSASLKSDEVAESVIYILNVPDSVLVYDMIMKATEEKY